MHYMLIQLELELELAEHRMTLQQHVQFHQKIYSLTD